MKRIVRNIVTVFLLVALIIPNVKADAASKYVSKKTITVTVNYDMNSGYNKNIYIKAKKNTWTKVSVKIVKMTGKAKYHPNTSQAKYKKIFLFDVGDENGSGCLAGIPKNKFKKGATIKLDNVLGSGSFSLDKPYGVKSVTYKFTFTSEDNKKTIQSVSVKDINYN